MMTTTTISKPVLARTFLSPGQRFQSSDILPDHNGAELIVSRLVRDPLGLLHVVLRAADGREISAYAEQVEAAIAEGHLAPVASAENLAIRA